MHTEKGHEMHARNGFNAMCPMRLLLLPVTPSTSWGLESALLRLVGFFV
jgi:hypothetical protein